MLGIIQVICVITVCICRLVMISIDLSETELSVRDKIQDNFFSDKIFFEEKNFRLNFVSDWILSQTEFCLRLDFVSDWILSQTESCLGLNFVSELYFMYNHLIL